MPAKWRVSVLLCACVFYLTPVTRGNLVVSHNDARTEETAETVRTRSIKKRSADSVNDVEVVSVKVDCTVASRYARTVMTSKALNHAGASREIFFQLDLPMTAFISNFSMEIGGQVYVGVVKGKEKAKREYDKAVSSGKTAGLVKASGRKMEQFSVSVNIAARSSVTFMLTYEELLQRKLGQYEILTRVKPKQPVQEFQIVANIYEPQGLAFVEPTATFLTNDLMSLVESTVMETKAHISFSPTLEQQRKCPGCEGTMIDGDFVIKYDVKREAGLGQVQIVNGYLVHFFAPPDLPRVPKNVVFVIDRSGSMSGRKIEQTRQALQAILRDLHEDDHFALIIFDNDVDTWKDSLTKATKGTVSKAISYVKKLGPNGSTDINAAVLKAVSMLAKDREKKNLPERSVDMIILLTDGMPNHGVSEPDQIQKNVRAAIGGNMSLFCLGFGNNVDYSFLDLMSRENKGLARRIFQGSDAELQLQGFYEEVSSPLLLDVDLRYPGNSVERLTKSHYSQLFNGSEIVVCAKLTDSSQDNVVVEVFGRGPKVDYVVHGQASALNLDATFPEQEYIFGDFSERMWAYLTTQQLLENSDIGTQEQRAEATAEALAMSLRYGFVTPLTSMVVTKPEMEDGPQQPLVADKLTEDQRQREERNKGSRGSMSGARSNNNAPRRRQKTRLHAHSRAAVDGDPHFMIELPDREDALCFSINDKPGTILNLVRDPPSGFVVNGEIIGKKTVAPGGKVNTYFGALGVVHRKFGLSLEVNTNNISVSCDGKQVVLLWSDTASITDNNVDIRLHGNSSLTVTLRHSVQFTVVRHTKVWKRRGEQQDYLGFYTLDSHHMSAQVHGLLGQFYHGVQFEIAHLRPGETGWDKMDATMFVKGHTLNVTRHMQRDFSRSVKDGESILCWFVDDEGAGLIDGQSSDYVASRLLESTF